MAVGLAWVASRWISMSLIGAGLVGAAAPVAVAWLTRAVVDGLVAGRPVDVLAGLAAALVTAGVLVAALPQAQQYLQAELGRRAGRASVERLHGAVGRLVGLRRFEDPRFLDRLRIATLGEYAPGQIVASGSSTVRSILTLAGFVMSLAVISPVMTMIVLLAAVPTFAAELLLARRRAGLIFHISPVERRELFYRELLTRTDAAQEVRLFGLAGFLTGRMLTERARADAAKHAIDRRQLRVQGGLALLGAVVAGGGLLWAVRSAGQGTLSIGDVTLFITATAGIQMSLSTAINQIAEVNQKVLEFDHYRAVVTGPLDLPVGTRPAPPLTRGIEFRDVWFRYSPDGPWALRGINLTIPSGAATALVGRNGAGKSTLVKLLCRFYDPERGAVLWDGIDIRELDPTSLRRRMTAVFQNFVEYDMSAAENIGLADVDAMDDIERIRVAARRAGVDDALTALPAGYQTLLSRIFFLNADRDDPSSGVLLSGGQWQRVAIARAYLRDQRDITILDEPSAGLDAEAEHWIHTGLRDYRAGQTSVLISHRLGAVRDADRILVLDDGTLVEQGTHAQLLAAYGVYARLFTLQAEGYTDAVEPSVVQW